MMGSFIYINYSYLMDDELDDDFKEACKEYGVPKNAEVSTVPVASITGHPAFFVMWDDENVTT